MNSQGPTEQAPNQFFWPLLMLITSILTASVAPAFAQESNDPLQLQKSGIARIEGWIEYVRKTGDAVSTVVELAKAEGELKTSFDLFMKRGDPGAASWSEIKLADIQRLQNRWAQAIPIYRAASELAKAAPRADYETRALARLAFSELKAGDTDAAENHAREAVRLGANCGNKDFYFDALDTAGEIAVKRGNLMAAGEYLDRALAMTGEVDPKLLYLGYVDRADIYYQTGVNCDPKRGINICNQSLDLAKADYQRALVITQKFGYDFISELYQSLLKQADEQKALLQSMNGDVLKDKQQMFSPKKAEDVLVGEHFASSGMDPANLAMIEAALKALKADMARFQQQGLYVQDLDPKDFFLQGSLDSMKNNEEAALASYRKSVQLLENDRRKLQDEQARAAFMEDKLSYYYYPAMILLDQKRYPEAFELFEQSRARAMADMLFSRQINLATAPERTLFSQLQASRTGIAALQEKLFNLTGGPDRDRNVKEIARLESQIADLQKQYETIETRIGKEAPKLKELTHSQPATLQSVQKSAADGGYDVLYYVVADPNLVVWHINGQEVHVKQVFLPQAELMQKVEKLNDSLLARRDNPAAKFDETVSRELFLFLIQPMLSTIKSNHIILVPQEDLHSIPFQVLQNPATGKYLGESFVISYVPSATVLSTLQKQASLKSGRLLAVADPGMHAAREEVNAIGKLYPGRSKVVTEEATKKSDIEKWVSDYRIVHLSVHGKFNARDPLLSYLQFEQSAPDNGHFTAAEMFGLPLQNNSVVVLSACETGRVAATHANEVLGMVRSLLYAGAGSLVLSEWEVDAGSTRLWMETFYREGQNRPPAEAARLALVAVKARPEYSHPFFWAPFVMTGK